MATIHPFCCCVGEIYYAYYTFAGPTIRVLMYQPWASPSQRWQVVGDFDLPYADTPGTLQPPVLALGQSDDLFVLRLYYSSCGDYIGYAEAPLPLKPGMSEFKFKGLVRIGDEYPRFSYRLAAVQSRIWRGVWELVQGEPHIRNINDPPAIFYQLARTHEWRKIEFENFTLSNMVDVKRYNMQCTSRLIANDVDRIQLITGEPEFAEYPLRTQFFTAERFSGFSNACPSHAVVGERAGPCFLLVGGFWPVGALDIAIGIAFGVNGTKEEDIFESRICDHAFISDYFPIGMYAYQNGNTYYGGFAYWSRTGGEGVVTRSVLIFKEFIAEWAANEWRKFFWGTSILWDDADHYGERVGLSPMGILGVMQNGTPFAIFITNEGTYEYTLHFSYPSGTPGGWFDDEIVQEFDPMIGSYANLEGTGAMHTGEQ